MGLPHISYIVIINFNTVTCLLVSSRVTFNQHFCRRRCFSFYWFGKREFGKLTNGIPVIGGPTRPPPPPFHSRNMLVGPIQERKSMGAIFQKKDKEMLKRAKFWKIWAKMYLI